MGSFGIPGFDSGLDVQGLVEQIMFVEREPIRRLERRKESFDLKIEAYNELNSKMSALSAALESISDGSAFSKLATSSEDDILTALASTTAVNGSYQIEVQRLAKFDNFVSDATFAAADAEIGTGTLEIQIGSESTQITIDSTNNTLEGLRDAVNSSMEGAGASIINDGSGFRLVLTSRESGSEHAISIGGNTLTTGGGETLSLTRTHSISDVSELDAELVINGLTVTSSSNQVDSAIEGITLDLKAISTGPVTLAVENDTESLKEALDVFVEKYNETYTFISGQLSTGTLAGDSVIRTIQSQLSGLIISAREDGTGALNSLADIGLELQNNGELRINSSVLDQALAENYSDVEGLLVDGGSASHVAVDYLGIGASTEGGSYELTVTQAAERAELLSPNQISSTLGVDEILTISLGSGVLTVGLTADMTIDDIVTAIHAEASQAGMAISASKDANNALLLQSDAFGSETTISVVSDVDSGGLGFGTVGLSDEGVDVAGTFTDVDTGLSYEGIGSGAVLTGNSGPVDGLRISVDEGQSGDLGAVTVSLGYAARLEGLLTSVTDSLEGPITGAVESLESSIRGIDDSISRMEERLELKRSLLLEQFTLANQALQRLSSMQSSLSSQFSQLSNLL